MKIALGVYPLRGQNFFRKTATFLPSHLYIGQSGKRAVPITDFDTLAEAEKQTGFYITLPDAIGSSDKRIYRAMNDEMLEVVYVNGEDETGRVRKARGHK